MPGFSLKVVEGGLKGEEFVLDQKGLCIIGRDKGCSISIAREKDVGISRRHSLLIIDPPNIRIRDLYSTNGTYVNGHRLLPAPIGETPEHENPNDRFLQEGDRIAISNIIMEVHYLATVESTQETTKQKLDEPLQTSQTTKTKLIEFSKGKTRANSLIPETNVIADETGGGEPESEILEETQLFLSLPITEPIPRPNRAMGGKNSKAESSPDNADKEDSDKDETPIEKPKEKDKKMPEKPDMSIITGGDSPEQPPPVPQPPVESISEEAEATPPAAPGADTEMESKNEEKPTPPVMPSFPEEKPEPPPVEEAERNDVGEKGEAEEKPAEDKPADKPKPGPHLLTKKMEDEEKETKPVEPTEPPAAPQKEEKKEEVAEESKPAEVEKEPEPEVKEEKVSKTETPDSSDRKRLFDSDKMKAMEELAGKLAHDYNKQLTVVMGYTELLKTSKDPAKIQEYADTIFRSAHLSSELTQQLLMFASHEHDTGGASVNLSDMITEIVSVMKHTSGRNISVEFTPNPETKGLYTVGNQLEIHEALLNIAFNSIDAMTGIGSLSFQIGTVSLTEDDVSKLAFEVAPGDFVKITVKDSGSGISDDDFERIFEPFFTTKKKDQALGMGLTVSYGVVKNHNGAIDVESNPGKGTTFEVFFPSAEKSNGKSVEKVDPREKLAEMEATVLLLDDEQNMRSLITEMLNLFKIEVKQCADPEDAVKEFSKDPKAIDLVIVDMTIPDRGDLDLYAELKQKDSDVKVLFSSGYKPTAREQNEMDGGNVEILPKPYSADELYGAVYELIK